MKKYIIFNLILALSGIFTKSYAYCVYNQTGSNIAKIRVTVYQNEGAALAGIGFERAGNIESKIPGLPFKDQIHTLYNFLSSTAHKARHVIARGQKACWNWMDIQHQLHNKNLFDLWFVFEDVNAKDSISLKAPKWVYLIDIRHAIVFCKKGNIAQVSLDVIDRRCGDQL